MIVQKYKTYTFLVIVSYFIFASLYLGMNNWFSEEQWLDESNSWFLPPPPQIFQSINSSQFDAYQDYDYSIIERLVSV